MILEARDSQSSETDLKETPSFQVKSQITDPTTALTRPA